MMERRSPFSAYFKIITNHIHLIFLTGSFDLDWPAVIQNFFDSTELAANVSDRIISMDCFIERTVYLDIARPYIYLLIYLTLPIMLVLVSLAVWGIIYRRNKTVMCNQTVKTTIILFYVIHPAITTHFIRIFHCLSIDNELHLVRDLQQICWTSGHLAWALGGAVPGLLIWGIGIPLASLLLLYSVRYDLDTDPVKEKYGFLYKGYKSRHYYWDAVIMFRKVAMIFIAVFFSFLGRIVSAMVIIVVLVLYLIYTVKRTPFNTRRLNQLEIVSLVSSSFTIYCGIFFISSRDSSDPNFVPNIDMTLTQGSRWLLVIIILLVNILFFTLWLSYFFIDIRLLFAKRTKKLFIACCLCCRVSKYQERRMIYLKDQQDAQVINQIQILQGELERVKDKYFWNRKFQDKFKFEKYLRKTIRRIDGLDMSKMKLNQYRVDHSLEDSYNMAKQQEDDHEEYLKHLTRQQNLDPQHKKNFASVSALKRINTMRAQREKSVSDVQPRLHVRKDFSVYEENNE